jgi:AraC-like DNA-binding protein
LVKKIEQSKPGRVVRPSVYHIDGEKYALDTCRPQREAIENGLIRFMALSHGSYPGIGLKKRELSGLHSIGVMDAAEHQEWGMAIHRNEGLEICLVEHGKPSFRVEGVRHQLAPRELTLTRPWQAHRHGDPHFEACRLHFVILDIGAQRPHQPWTWPEWLVLSSADKQELTRHLRNRSDTRLSATDEILHHFQSIARAMRNNSAPPLSETAIGLNALLMGLLKQFRSMPEPSRPDLAMPAATIELFLDDLRVNPVSRNHEWTLEEMAEECAMGVTRFCNLTRTRYNRSPMKLLCTWRLEAAAKELRQHPGASVTEVAFRNGFNSSQYFATCFRRRFRCSPRRYGTGGSW